MRLPILTALALIAASLPAQVACTFTNFGRPCGGVLQGTQITRLPAVRLDLSRAAPGSFALLAMGSQRLPRPVQIPGGNCFLLVQPRATALQQVDPRGLASWHLRLPNATPRTTIDFQAVTVQIGRNGISTGSSNGVEMTCR